MKHNIIYILCLVLFFITANSQNIHNGNVKITGGTHLTFAYPTGDAVINFGNDSIGDLYFRALPIGGNINSFNNLMILTNDGKLGLGTTNLENFKLSVNGKIRAKSVIINSDWADYVFNDNYNLMPITDVKKYIENNKHLPGFADEKSIKDNGVDVGEMQVKLLEKIEELTLYIIKLNEEYTQLKEEINVLKTIYKK
ncbi:MAG: hypothetical protein IJ180_10525 [Bacteroidales bacterium]|nr:hypothetical protein [Bacteroidales bacterium]